MTDYKTKNGQQTGFVPGIGEIVGGVLKNAPANLENPNLEPIVPQPTVPAAPAPAPTQVSQPQPQQQTIEKKETE